MTAGLPPLPEEMLDGSRPHGTAILKLVVLTPLAIGAVVLGVAFTHGVVQSVVPGALLVLPALLIGVGGYLWHYFRTAPRHPHWWQVTLRSVYATIVTMVGVYAANTLGLAIYIIAVGATWNGGK